MKLNNLIVKYNLVANGYNLPDEEDYSRICSKLDNLIATYDKYVSLGWYGFDLPNNLPEVWYDVLNELLAYLADNYSQFEINQIKLKFGGIRIYLSGIDNTARILVNNIEELLYDEKLIY